MSVTSGRGWLWLLLLLGLLPVACSTQHGREPQGPRSPAQINAELGVRYMQQGNLDVALDKLRRALEQDPKLPAAHHYIALLYNRLGSPELAEKHFQRALELTPKDPALLNNYGVFLCGHGHYDAAIERFLQTLQVPEYRRPDEAYENAGLCALRIPDRARAEAYFRHALKVNPLRASTLYQMMKLSYEEQRYRQARAFLQRYERVARHNPRSLWLALQMEKQLGNQRAVAAYSQMLREKFPDSPETRALTAQE